MAKEVIMPKAGMDMQEGQIISWKKKEGDKVEKGEILLEIMTDKVSMEVEAESSGYLLKILAQEGETIPVITTIAYIGKEGEVISDSKASAKAETVQPIAEVAADVTKLSDNSDYVGADVDGKVRATPKARAFAKDNGISLYNIKGTQENGRICYNDVVNYKNSAPKASALATSVITIDGVELPAGFVGSGVDGKIMKSDIENYVNSLKSPAVSVQVSAPAQIGDKPIRVQKMNTMRTTIARRMKESYLESPVVHYQLSVDMSDVKKFLNNYKASSKEASENKISINDVVLLAVSRALMKFPNLNSSVNMQTNEIIYHDYVDLAMAVGLEEGLVTPIIRDAHKKSLLQISADAKEIAQKAKNMKLATGDLEGSTFTVSNIGMFGTEYFTPIINQPNTAILGVCAMIDTPVVRDGQICIRPIMKLSLSADHRISDGVVCAQFLKYLKDSIENLTLLLL